MVTARIGYLTGISFAQISDGAPNLPNGIVLNRYGPGQSSYGFSLTDSWQYASYSWSVNGSLVSSYDSYTLNAVIYLFGQYYLTVEVVKDGKRYNTTIPFSVVY